MEERVNPSIPMKILLVEPAQEQLQTLEQEFSEWDWVSAPAGWPVTGESHLIQNDINVVMVFARPKEEKYALGLCKKIKDFPQGEQIPLLIVINRYQMMLGADVRKLPRANFIIAPLEKDHLLKRMEEVGVPVNYEYGMRKT